MGHDGGRSYYQIERNELIIGSSLQCDVVLPRPEISRRHLSLLVRGERYFVIDHNSTNGTFLNEEKIESGQKIEWKTYIPLRLATEVIITLVEDATSGDEMYQATTIEKNRSEQTRTIVIPLAQLKASSKKGAPRSRGKKEKKGMGMVYLVVVTKGLKLDSLKLKGKRTSTSK
jgi:pSer/pThr/pTyr-binding forkhead associated (FHA) protein